MKEYDVGIKHEKSALENFVDNYVIEEEPGVNLCHFIIPNKRIFLVKSVYEKS